MQTNENPKSAFQSILDILSIIGILFILGFFAWHTVSYMNKIFVQVGGEARNYRDLSAAAVQVAVVVSVVWVVYIIRGGGQDKDDRGGGQTGDDVPDSPASE